MYENRLAAFQKSLTIDVFQAGMILHLLLTLLQLFLSVLLFGPLTYIFLNELLRTFVYATKFSWLDPVYPILFALAAIIGLCSYQAFRLNRSDFVEVLKG